MTDQQQSATYQFSAKLVEDVSVSESGAVELILTDKGNRYLRGTVWESMRVRNNPFFGGQDDE